MIQASVRGLARAGLALSLLALACTTLVGLEELPVLREQGAAGSFSSGASGNPDAGADSGGSGATPSGGSATQGGGGQPGDSASGAGGASGGEASGGSVGRPCRKPGGGVCHDVLITDDYHHQVTLVSEFESPFSSGAIHWGGPGSGIPGVVSPRSMQLVDDPTAVKGKSVLVSIADGFVEMDIGGNGRRLVSVEGLSGVRSACRLRLGETALATDTEMVIVDEDGAVVRSFDLPAGAPFGIVRHNPETRTFWFARGSTVYEVNELGGIVSTLQGPAGHDLHSVSWREGGGFFATTGAGATLIEVNGKGELLTTRGGQQSLPELQYLAGFHLLANGNVIVANWLGAVPFPEHDTPHLVELTPENEIVWRWGNQDLSRQIADVLVLH